MTPQPMGLKELIPDGSFSKGLPSAVWFISPLPHPAHSIVQIIRSTKPKQNANHLLMVKLNVLALSYSPQLGHSGGQRFTNVGSTFLDNLMWVSYSVAECHMEERRHCLMLSIVSLTERDSVSRCGACACVEVSANVPVPQRVTLQHPATSKSIPHSQPNAQH